MIEQKHLDRAAKRVMDSFKESEVVNVIVQDNRMYITLKSGRNFELSSDEISYQVDMSSKLQVKASEFLEWMYSDREDMQSLGRDLLSVLKRNGYVNITIKDIYNAAEYVTSDIVEGYTGEYTRDFETSEVELINDITE